MTTITVVEHEGELLFEVGGLKFDALRPYFEHAEVLVIHKGNEIDRARIDYVGPQLRFTGFTRLFQETRDGWYQEASKYSLRATDFLPGDSLVLDMEVSESDFADFLRNDGLWSTAFRAVITSSEDSLTLSEIERRMSEKMEKDEESLSKVEVIRFVPK